MADVYKNTLKSQGQASKLTEHTHRWTCSFLKGAPLGGRESSPPPCFSTRAPPRSSSGSASARGKRHDQAPPGTHGLSDSGRTAGSQSPAAALTKHALGAKAATHTHHAREHLLGCEDVQRVFHTGVSSQNLEQPTALSRSTR